MTTSPLVGFGLYALSVAQDSGPVCPDTQPFSKVADLKTGNATSLPYASYEPDFWLLDGGYKFMPADEAAVHVGLMSLAMSDAAGAFADPPVLTVNFTYPHTSDGLALHFSQYSSDYASSITVAYYDAAASLIREDTYTPTSWDFQTGQAVSNFQQIVITFHATNKPYRYLRLTGIDYGTLIYFSGTQIKRASVVEETDMLSGEARYNTLDLTLHSSDGQFSIISPGSYYQYLQQYQPIAAYERVGNQTMFMGQFYTKEWENKSDTEIEFRCIDLLGVLDTITYNGGFWTGTDLQTVLEAMLTPINVPYDLDASLYTAQVKGWLPICSYREALQQIALAVGAYLDCSRSSTIKIYPTPIAATTPAYSATITKGDKGANQSLALKPLVTAVEVTAHNYVSVTTSKTLYTGTLAVGTYTITWNEPIHNLTISGGTIDESGVNYAVITRAGSTGTVTVTGQIYNDVKRVFKTILSPLPEGTKPNVLKITEGTLISNDNGAAVCQRVYNYNQQRYLQKFMAFAPTTYQTGNIVLVDTLYNQQIRCTVEKMSIDLARGMVAQVELTGVLHE